MSERANSRRFPEVVVSVLPPCDVCRAAGEERLAGYDAKLLDGPWAYLCERDFLLLTDRTLGTGRGQRLVLLPAQDEGQE